MSNQSSTTTINNTPKDELHQIMVEMFMMIEEMDIQEGKYLEFAEMFKSMNLNIDRLAGMRQQIIVNTYYQRHVRPQRASSNPRLTEAQKENSSHYSLCNCGRYVSNVTPKSTPRLKPKSFSSASLLSIQVRWIEKGLLKKSKRRLTL